MSDRTDEAVICHVCGYRNLVGALICENCGTMLSKDVVTGTRNLTGELPELQTNRVFAIPGDITFQEGMRLRVIIDQDSGDMFVDPSQGDILMGRRDPVSRQRPDIDLEDYKGYRMGVSRKHALISIKGHDLTLQDYGSANGTYLNGVRLPAHRAHKLHDGDEIRLGHLRMRLFFVD